ncbi:hypothetical protein P355_3995 [Burkholderia cenocepacia KC-01]|nr:hypothetical protein P355_3995 [Burkholderia cenocepacia KC-01]
MGLRGRALTVRAPRIGPSRQGGPCDFPHRAAREIPRRAV